MFKLIVSAVWTRDPLLEVGGLPPSSRVLPVISTVKVSDECGPTASVQRWVFSGEILVKSWDGGCILKITNLI